MSFSFVSLNSMIKPLQLSLLVPFCFLSCYDAKGSPFLPSSRVLKALPQNAKYLERKTGNVEQVEGTAEEPRSCWLAALSCLKLAQKTWN